MELPRTKGCAQTNRCLNQLLRSGAFATNVIYTDAYVAAISMVGSSSRSHS